MKNQNDSVNGIFYRLSRWGSSDKYGPCEICNKHAESIYLLSTQRRYDETGKEALTHYECPPVRFGHKTCLASLTETIQLQFVR